MDPNRQTAFEALTASEKDAAYTNLEIKKALSRGNADFPGFVRELVYGVTEYRLYLDYILDKIIRRGVASVRPPVLILMRMGLYQILFMDSVPDYAAVNETVTMTRRYAKGLEAFVNGVLRTAVHKARTVKLPDRGDMTEYLSIRYSCGKSLVMLLLGQYGEDMTERILAHSLDKPPLDIRCNLLRTTRDSLAERLRAKEICSAPIENSERMLTVKGSDITETEEYANGLFSIQSRESEAIAAAAAPLQGDEVIDMCAAPGGKTTAMAEAMKNRGHITAIDMYDHRLSLINSQAQRLGITIIDTVCADAAEKLTDLPLADVVLADVPCSGIGVIREKPEIKYKNFDDLYDLYQTQRRILEQSFAHVKPGGRLVYSTCTINKMENEEIVRSFTAMTGNAALSGCTVFGPHMDGNDGFFAAVITKIVK